MSAFIAQGLIASTNESFDSGNGKAIQRWELASENRIASIGRAIEVISASDVCVNASGLRIASVDGTSVEILAIGADIERNVAASGHNVAKIFGAGVVVVASLASVDTFSRGNVTRIICARIGIVTINGGLIAFPIHVIAFVYLAIDWSAGNIETFVARNE